MATITSLQFAISSNWDGQGTDEAKSAIASLKADIEAMASTQLGITINLEGVDEARAEIDSLTEGRRTLDIDVNAETADARADIDETARDREAVIDVVSQGLDEIRTSMSEAAQDRRALIDVVTEGVELARAQIDETARDRRTKVAVDADTSALGGLAGMLKEHIVLVGALSAAFVSLGAVAAMVGAAMTTALGGGVIAAAAAVTTEFNKMSAAQSEATKTAQEQANTANNALASAYQNVTDTAETGARSIKTANEESVSANEALIQSQKDVAQAYQDAQRNLEDLQMQQSMSGDNIEAASIAVARAQDKLAKGPSKNSTDPALDQRENLNNLALAQDHLREVQQKAQRTQEDYDKAQAQGIEGSDKVVAAKQKEQEAQQKADDAQQNIAVVQKQVAENNAKAAQALADAQTKAADAQSALNKAIEKGQSAAMQFMSTLNDMVAPLQGPLHSALDSLKQQLTDMEPQLQNMFAAAAPLVQPFVDSLTGAVRGAIPGFTTALQGMSPMVDGIKTGMTNLGTQIGQTFSDMAAAAPSFGKIWSDFGENFGHFMDLWAQFTTKVAPEAATTLQHFGEGINSVTGGILNGMAGAYKNMSGGPSLIQTTATGIGQIGQQALPAVGTTVKAADNALAKPLAAVAKPIGDTLSNVFTSIAPETLNAMGPGLQTMADAFGKIVTALQPLIPLIGDFTSGMGGGMGEAIKLAAPLLENVARIIGDMATGLKPIAPAITAIGFAFGIWKAATIAFTVVQAAFNLVMDANPISLIVIAIAALVGGIIYLATKTQFFQILWRDVWGFVKEAALAFWNWLKDGFIGQIVQGIIGLVSNWKQYWNDIVEFVKRIWNDIKQGWDDATGWLSKVFSQNIAILKTAWNEIWTWIKDFVTGLWDDIKTGWTTFIDDGIKKPFDTFVNILKTAWDDFWTGIKTAAMVIWDAIKTAFETFKEDFHKGFQALVDKVKDIWNGIKKVFADPINVIFRIMNDTVGKVIPALHFNEMHGDGYAEGGWTGPGSKYQPAGIVHADEYVISQRARSAIESSHPGLLDHMNATGRVPGYDEGGKVIGSATSDSTNGATSTTTAIDWMIAQAAKVAPAMQVTSTFRAGDPGYHGQGKAVDFSNGTDDTPQMQDFASWIAKTWGSQTLELIHAPFQHNIKDGKDVGDGMGLYGAQTMSEHHNHVHWAVPGPLDDTKKGGGFFGAIGSFISDAVNVVRTGAADAFVSATNPILNAIPSPIPGTGSPMGDLPKQFATHGRDEVANFIRGKESASTSAGAPFSSYVIPSAEHKALIDQALALAGPGSDSQQDWEAGLETLISRESSWNPAAINLSDSNAAKGTPSKGLMQEIDDTFNADKVPGHDNIWEPLDNVAAGINYIKRRYGSIHNVEQANANMAPLGYAAGTDSATPGWALVGELGPELVKFAGGEEVVNNQDLNNRLQTLNSTMAASQTKATEAGKSFVNSTVDQFGEDIGLGSITNGSGVIPNLLKEGNSYVQSLLQWHQEGKGIFAGLQPQQQTQTQQPQSVTINGVDPQQAVKEFFDRQKMQALGYDGYGNG